MADIEFEIDGRKLTAKANQTVIQVADDAGIYIPRFCYHKSLSIPANCRMCLVEIEKSAKPLPACATQVLPGMKVFTKSEKTILAQRAVMEFLLINHPLDCPICDQGGECELQDLSMGYGSCQSKYTESKRSVADQDLGPLISTEMTRCIYCTRCVRFGEELAGLRELGAIGRGEFTEISTYIQHAVHSEVSGNIIDLCPVGALTSKPFRFTARAWELDQSPSVSPHDCIGSNLNVHTRYGEVMRVVSRENMAINEMWLSDRDRFSYTGLYHADRLKEPLARVKGKLQTVSWQEAFAMAAQGLQDVILKDGAQECGALASPNSTLEEFYLLQKLMRELGSPHIDHRLREMNTSDQEQMGAFPGLNLPINEIEECDAILLIGSNIQNEQPLAALRIRKAELKGAAITAINPVDYRFSFKLTAKKIVAPQYMVAALNDAIKEYSDAEKTIATHLRDKKKSLILLGALALHHPEAATIRYLAQQLANLCGARLGFLTDGANSAGGWLAGAIPHRRPGGAAVDTLGLSAYDMLKKQLKAFLLLNVEPECDCANAHLARAALKEAQCVLALSSYRNSELEKYAHVIFPMTPFTETSGTFVNTAGVWQSFKGVAKSVGSARPAWKILRVLGNFLHLPGFGYESSEEVKEEVRAVVDRMQAMTMHFSAPQKKNVMQGISRIGEIPIYAGDSLVRRAKPLQTAQTIMQGELAVVRLHPETATRLKLRENQLAHIKQNVSEAQLRVILDARVAIDAAWIAGGIAASAGLGDLFGEIEIRQ